MITSFGRKKNWGELFSLFGFEIGNLKKSKIVGNKV